jgi:4-aminobutyrate aminotransferase-like enzyme
MTVTASDCSQVARNNTASDCSQVARNNTASDCSQVARNSTASDSSQIARNSAASTVFETLESNVRGYCRAWPTVFDTGSGAWLRDENGKDYLDFFAGAGALNYGHNNPVLKRALLDYIVGDGITHSLRYVDRRHDQWAPGEHNGTFRGNNAAFVTGRVALEHYWSDSALEPATLANGERIARALDGLAEAFEGVSARGRGLVHGVVFEDASLAEKVGQAAFDRGLLVETSGSAEEVIELMPPLTVTDDDRSRYSPVDRSDGGGLRLRCCGDLTALPMGR